MDLVEQKRALSPAPESFYDGIKPIDHPRFKFVPGHSAGRFDFQPGDGTSYRGVLQCDKEGGVTICLENLHAEMIRISGEGLGEWVKFHPEALAAYPSTKDQYRAWVDGFDLFSDPLVKQIERDSKCNPWTAVAFLALALIFTPQ